MVQRNSLSGNYKIDKTDLKMDYLTIPYQAGTKMSVFVSSRSLHFLKAYPYRRSVHSYVSFQLSGLLLE